MLKWTMVMEHEQRRHQQMAEAEQQRLAASLQPKHVPVIRPLIVSLGRRMMWWGIRLQARYGEFNVDEATEGFLAPQHNAR